MSHSKINKNGYSLYIEKWNPKAKKYINTCALCGSQGYSPSINCEGFDNDNIRRVMRNELKKTFPELHLDDHGRCEDCAKRLNKQSEN